MLNVRSIDPNDTFLELTSHAFYRTDYTVVVGTYLIDSQVKIIALDRVDGIKFLILLLQLDFMIDIKLILWCLFFTVISS